MVTEKVETGKWPAVGLGALQVFIGLGAVPPGLSLIFDPSGAGLGMPQALLANSPFSSFLMPGIALLLVNGAGSLIGAAASFWRYRYAGEIAVALGLFLMAWIGLQVWWIGLSYWLQPLYFILGLIELALGLKLRQTLRSLG